jgi:GNAT superfamily N-acetyltransferase
MNERETMQVRRAISSDVGLIFSFLQKKAAFDHQIGAFPGVLQVSEEKIRQTLFGPIAFAHVLFVETRGQPVGFALYEFRYSSFVGQPSIWLDDLYVDENRRSQGAGTALMQDLAQIARKNDCTHLAWTADSRNRRGLSFYQRLGAEITEQKAYRCFWAWTP